MPVTRKSPRMSSHYGGQPELRRADWERRFRLVCVECPGRPRHRGRAESKTRERWHPLRTRELYLCFTA
uniref:Uncharacterized protein n=1 Tax=Setaria digitata TaxID=48799 RepID=A0A915PM07_9BILA